jgi:hypothetical protein
MKIRPHPQKKFLARQPMRLGKTPRVEMINDFYKNFSGKFAEITNDFCDLEMINDFYKHEF